MNEFQEFMQMVVDASDEQRIALGKQALGDAIKIFIKYGLTQDQTLIFVKDLIKLFVGADGTCSKRELDLFNAITGIPLREEEFYELTNGGSDPEFVQAIDDVIDCLSVSEKAPICLFGLTILASDDELTPEEQELFTKLSN